MIQICIGVIIAVFPLILIPIIIKYQNYEKKFSQNKVQCNATIVGYATEDFCRWDTPQVILETDGSRKIYRCNSKKVNYQTFTKGVDVVRVEYYVHKAFGRDWYDIRMTDPRYAPNYKTVIIGLWVFAVLLTISSMALIIIGLGMF